MIAVAWIIFAAVVLAVIAFCYVIVKYYQDRSESEKIPTIITTFALSLVLFCVFLIPVDIYSVSSTEGFSQEDIQTRVKFIRYAYYVLYSLVLFFSFALVPFAYFYYEEDDEDITLGQKIWGGLKYTIFTLIIVIILMVVGIVLAVVKPAEKPTVANAKNWIANLVKTTPADGALYFAIAALTTIGFVSWISYTAYGLTAFPIGIIRGRNSVSEDRNDLSSDLETTREKKRRLRVNI